MMAASSATLPDATTSSPATRLQERRDKRTSNACELCRRSKVKCSGELPCVTCRKRRVECIFVQQGRKVAVSQRYLERLRSEARTGPQPHAPSQEPETANGHGPKVLNDLPQASSATLPSYYPISPPSDDVGTSDEIRIYGNPFSAPPLLLRNPRGTQRGWVYAAPSSTWGFNLRLSAMILGHLSADTSLRLPVTQDGDAYSLKWDKVSMAKSPWEMTLPPQDFAIYLFNTVKFHLGQTFRLVDETGFMAHVQELYNDAPKKMAESSLWFVQFTLILAFGTAFVGQSKNSIDAPGSKYFTHAMSSMPETLAIWEDPVMAVEIYALAALYLYSVNMRETAFLYIGQATRIALMEGLNTDLPIAPFGEEAAKRRHNLWWTIYILDQRISAAVGSPLSVPENAITVKSLAADVLTQRDATLSLHVQVSRLIHTVLTTIYIKDPGLDISYLECTKSILKKLADLALSLENLIAGLFKNSVNVLPKGILHVMLSYHHCVILATRPLLLCVLEDRLKRSHMRGARRRALSPAFAALINSGLDSANRTLKIVSSLIEQDLLETFLPFDLDFTFSAALYLIAADYLFAGMIQMPRFREELHRILAEMCVKGTRVAQLRRSDLELLEENFASLAEQEANLSAQHTQPNAATEDAMATSTRGEAGPERVQYSREGLPSPFLLNSPAPEGASSGENSSGNMGLSSNALAALLHRIDHGGNNTYSGGSWLWEEDLAS